MRRIVVGLMLAVSIVASAGVLAAGSSSATGSSTGLSALQKLFGSADKGSDLLPPDQAFQVTIHARDATTLVADLTPAKDYYLYRDRTKFRVQSPAGITIANVDLPRGEIKDDPAFGKVEVYRHPVQTIITLNRKNLDAGRLTLHATYQGCNEPVGVCYPPIEKSYDVTLPTAAAGNTTNSSIELPRRAASGTAATNSAGASPGIDESTRIARIFRHGNLWIVVAAFFGFGVLLAFTPCMLPMIPILSGVVVGQGKQLTKGRALGLSSVYVLGMAITYALAGVAAGLTGTLLSAALQTPWVLGSFAALFVILAFSMFGFYELQLPASWQTRLANVSGRLKGGKLAGVFAMGILSALIVGPCVAAPLAGALLYIGQTHNVALGGTALFAMAIGMGVPLIAIGASAGALLPKAGPWMDGIKKLFGIVLLGVAIWTISPLVPVVAQMLLWAALLIICAIYLRVLDSLPQSSPGFMRLGKGVGVIALVAGAALLIGVLSGSRDMLQPLAVLRSAGDTATVDPAPIQFRKIKNITDLNTQLQVARGGYVMLDFWAEWCISCKEMDRYTFTDQRVKARLKDTVLLRADVTANDAQDQALLKHFNLFGPPGIIFFDPQGKEIPFRVIGYQPPREFLASLDRVFGR
jgi:thiol:disulfide interchange protein DsbD